MEGRSGTLGATRAGVGAALFKRRPAGLEKGLQVTCCPALLVREGRHWQEGDEYVRKEEECCSRQRKPHSGKLRDGKGQSVHGTGILASLFEMHGSSKKVGGLIQIVEGGLTSSKAG